MRAKIGAALLTVGIALIALAPTASATKPDEDGFHKVTICHNVGHNGHAISIDVAAVGITDVKGGHGVITFNENGDFVSFVAHDGNGGHDQDFYLHKGAENKPEDDERCKPEVPTTTTTAPPVTTTTTEPPVVTTTTTVPEVTTTTVPEVTTTTEPSAPVVTTTTPPVTAVPETVVPVTEVPVVPVATDDELAFGGAYSAMMAMYGAGLGLIGLSLLTMFGKRKAVQA